jgi:quinoprotein glucose dehydrogenase
MPGNQGGSNWGTTAADPQKGMVFVVGVNQVALLKLEDVAKRTNTGRGGAAGGAPQNPALQDGFLAYQTHCTACHGANLQGALPGVANLVGVTDRMGEDAIKAVVTGGKGEMRPVSAISETEMTAVISYLASMSPTAGRFGGGGNRGRGAGPAAVFPAGPIAETVASASGSAWRSMGPFYPGRGETPATIPIPRTTEVPSIRYMSDYGVLASFTKLP